MIKDNRWYRFMKEDWWVVTMNVVRITSIIIVIVAISYMVKEIEAVKLLAYDPCKVCMEQPGVQCFAFP